MKYLIFIISIITSLQASAGLTFSGTMSRVIEIKPETNTGLEAIYVLDNCTGVTASFTTSSATSIAQWSKYSSMGGAYAQPVSSSTDGTISTISLNSEDMGYIVTENNRQHCFWIIDYSLHEMSIETAVPDIENSDCIMTTISIQGQASPIPYYTINGIPKELSREISVKYNTLEWDSTTENYHQRPSTETITSYTSSIHIPAPLCDTDFEITADRFLREWNREIIYTTPLYNAIAVDAHATASMNYRDNSNEIKDNSSELGGSAPADITFTGLATDAVAFREWQMSRDPEFNVIDLRFNQDEVSYTFREQGTTYVRFIVANNNGDCDWTSEVFQVNIGDSRLECPNAFSPGASEGVNDEWKVSYQSIVSFECHIFNRWGNQIFSTSDPAKGWDGKYNGKLVPAGVYFYVIKAKGADGKNYNRSGDINIINYSKGANHPSYQQ